MFFDSYLFRTKSQSVNLVVTCVCVCVCLCLSTCTCESESERERESLVNVFWEVNLPIMKGECVGGACCNLSFVVDLNKESKLYKNLKK